MQRATVLHSPCKFYGVSQTLTVLMEVPSNTGLADSFTLTELELFLNGLSHAPV